MRTPASWRAFASGVLTLIVVGVLPASAAEHARKGRTETALDRYVAAPDPAFAWKKVATTTLPGATGYTLEMTSQTWRTPAEVNRTEWKHWVTIVKPDTVKHATALLLIRGGSNRPGDPPKPAAEMAQIATGTQSVVVDVRMIPNQPLTLADGVARTEDELIVYTWDKFMRTGDERWPLRLPMTKAVVRAMDAATAFLASEEGGGAKVDRFVVAGESKRGWTTWTTAAVDERVVAIAPMVIDVLNVEKVIEHHYRAYGFFAPAVEPYEKSHVIDWAGGPESRALYDIEDPFSYRDRLTMPKLMINATGDEFFLPDASQFYFGELRGVKYLRYVPNVSHSLRPSDAYLSVAAWHHAILNHTELPQFSWTRGEDGSLTVTTKTKPVEVKAWQATNPTARDFRLEKIGAVWKSAAVEDRDGVYRFTVAKPESGWTAGFVELTFDIGAPAPIKLTTDVMIMPNTLPFAAPKFDRPKGFLSGATPSTR